MTKSAEIMTMTVHYMIYLFLSHMVSLPIMCYNPVPPRPGPPFLQCFSDLCWTDYKASGSMVGEPLAGYITPDTNITIVDSSDSPSASTGDIVLYNADHIPRLESAVLGTTILPRFDDFKRYITDTDGVDIGYMLMERPVPDPDTIFKDLSQDSLLAGIPAGLRSEVNPASLVPSPTEGCTKSTSTCVLVIPVSIMIDIYQISTNFDTVIVRGCLLFRSRANEHGLSPRDNESATISFATPCVDVRDCAMAESE